MQFQERIAASPDIVVQMVRNRAVILDLKSKNLLSLDPVGSRMWSAVTSAENLQMAFDCLLQEYDVDQERLQQDLSDFVSQLIDSGLLVVCGQEISMSGVAGIVHLDGKPVAEADLQRMLTPMSYRGPDGQGVWSKGAAGLAQLMLHTTPESLKEKQPCTIDGEVWISTDARIDNREELFAELGLQGSVRFSQITDVELILHSYARWETDCVKHLVGPFAFVLWDGRKRRLMCAADPMGVAVLHYCLVDGTFLTASAIEAILAALPQQPPPNEPLIADFLVHWFARGVDQTFYRDIKRLPPGYLLLLENGQLKLERYYHLGSGNLLHYPDERDYFEHYRELFQKAVKANLRSHQPVHIQVSGGLDSSSTACVADQLAASGELVDVPQLFTLTNVAPVGWHENESEFQQAVIAACPNLESVLVNLEDHWALQDFADEHGFPFYHPETHPMRSWIAADLKRVAAGGGRVLLSGGGADFLLGAHIQYHYPQVLADLSWQRRLTELGHYRRRDSLAQIIYAACLRPAARRLAPERWLYRRKNRKFLRRAGWVQREWFLAQRSQESYRSPLTRPAVPSVVTGLAYDWLMYGLNSMWHASHDILGAFYGVQWRFPYLDLRLVEFLLQLPSDLIIRDGLHKVVLRQAMQGIVPQQVLNRTDSTIVWESLHRGLKDKTKSKAENLFGESRLAARGWIDQESWWQAWRDYMAGNNEDYQPLVDSINVEGWLRFYERQ